MMCVIAFIAGSVTTAAFLFLLHMFILEMQAADRSEDR